METLSWISEKAKTKDEFNELIEKQRKRIFDIHHEINALAQQVCDTYDEFIRLGRRKLAV